jgi:tropomyosin-1
VNDVDVYKAHESLDAAERQVGELEEELKAAVSSMSNCSPGQHPEKKIRDITLRLKEAEHRATVAERSVFQLRREAARHNDEIKADKKKHQPISARLSSCTFTELTGC